MAGRHNRNSLSSNIEKAEDTLPSDVEPQTAMPKKRGRKSKEKAAE